MPEMNSVTLNGVKIDLVDDVARQTAKEAKTAVGAPLVASTASQMTNTNKVYVYTGSESGYVNGNWYYYDGSAWVSGGVYNSAGIDTDKTLSVADKAADAKATGDEISQLKSDLTEVQDVLIEKTSTSLVNNADDVGSGPMANTRRWFLPYVIPANSKIANIAYHTASSVSGTIIFEVWKKIGTELTLDKSVEHTPVASSVNTVGINYISTSDVMIGWRIVGGTNIRQRGSTSFNMWGSTDLQSTTLSTSSLDKMAFTTYTPCITVPYDTTKVVDFFQLPNNVITIGEGMDYEEIQDALLGITDDSATNPYTFLLMPKGTPYKPFTMIRDSFSDTYPWSGKSPRHISIIGLDREHCVIQSDSGDYKHPCGEPLTNGVIKNIKFVMTNNEQTETATQGGYCLHIDSKTLNAVGYKMIIEDCDFEDASGPCLGIGVHANCDLQIRRCRFNTTLSANYNPHEGYTNLVDYGAVFCHTSTADIAPNQKFTLEDCVGVCAEGDKALRINVTAQYNPSTSSFVYTLLRNVFWNKTLNASGYQISASLTANSMNYGNNNA